MNIPSRQRLTLGEFRASILSGFFILGTVAVWHLQGFEAITSDHYQYNASALMQGSDIAQALDWSRSTSVHHLFWQWITRFVEMAGLSWIFLYALFILCPVLVFMALRDFGIESWLTPLVTLLILLDPRAWFGDSLFSHSQSLPHFLSMAIGLLVVGKYYVRKYGQSFCIISVLFVVHFSTAMFITILLVIVTVGSREEIKSIRRSLSSELRPHRVATVLSFMLLLISSLNAIRFAFGRDSNTEFGFGIIRNIRAPWHYNIMASTAAQLLSVGLSLAILLAIRWQEKSRLNSLTLNLFLGNLFLCAFSELMLEVNNFALIDALWPERTLPIMGVLSLIAYLRFLENLRSCRRKVAQFAGVSLTVLLAFSVRSDFGMWLLLLFGSAVLTEGAKLGRGSHVQGLGVRSFEIGSRVGSVFVIGAVLIESVVPDGRGLLAAGGTFIGWAHGMFTSVWRFPLLFAILMLLMAIVRKKQFFNGGASNPSAFRLQAKPTSVALLLLILIGLGSMSVRPSAVTRDGSTLIEFSLLDADEQELQDFSKSSLPENEIYLIPPGLSMFRSIAARAVVVDFKSVPLEPSDYAEWFERLNRVSGTELDFTELHRDALQEYSDAYCMRDLQDLVETARAYDAQVLVLQEGCTANELAPSTLSHFASWRDLRFYDIN